jgi:ABC-type dipeptide/oligopeptide/nickel transport system permease component
MFGIYVLFSLMKMSSAYHLEAYAQTKNTNRILEDMLKSYVGHKQTLWEQYLFIVEFAYNVS